ncbi:hypothetical protein BU24DRAFT_442134 [Aaosphaeria arxii CBS 175.79]|uniref:Exonuclease domain-containing protein n=1 Tax=Aaosphaeria arxii CBS 175.79 TaxID=1450172 RepID=A0A6A5XRK3_9PLEO|nr:uncharacterized protein BU24DRAFT_442134 [Aaosphaeria arxii CBS 175.79]KAF2014934.1 hypothetical protein BU24DRAFT_442134 [Aaosphaeria arxii CBS 175.79]
MWPSLSSFRPFGGVACPAGAKCEAINCLFSHAPTPPKPQIISSEISAPDIQEREPKRLKIDDSAKKSVPSFPHPKPTVFTGSLVNKETSALGHKTITGANHDSTSSKSQDQKSTVPRSVIKTVSPPPKTTGAKAAVPDPEVKLAPRKLTKEPAQLAKRFTLLKALRQYMVPLNDKVSKSPDPAIKKLRLTDNQLNKVAIDEEARFGEQHGTVYENVLKQRLVALKKMTVDTWVKERQVATAPKKSVEPIKEKPKPVETGLSEKEEVAFLSHLKSSQDGLDAHGYVTKLPTQAELDNTWQTLAAADHWEKCDRCNTRFQVFPNRREEDGALTTGGRCKHHWGKKMWPKTAKGHMPGSSTWTCCGQTVGSEGCTTHETHVFKVSDPKRLATIMPFVETPENARADPHAAICFDCEMGYTTKGLELLRVTAVSWPSHKPVLDVLVRPLGHVLDLNTRFSGVTSEQFLGAPDYDAKKPSFDAKNLQIVDSPQFARDLFLSLISPSTPLLGHALENDLNSIRLIHPVFIDTVLLYPHFKGLPIRNSLRGLAKTHLNLEIQQAGAAGHDSYEDARATGELIRYKVATEWKKMKRDGWTISEDGLLPPVPSGTPPTQSTTSERTKTRILRLM